MGIDVALVNEGHEATQEVFDPRQCLTLLATSAWPKQKDSVCVRFIDAFGDTVFNQAQIPFLLKELEHSEALQTDAEVKAHLHKVCRLVLQAYGKTHMYIKFIGD